MRVLAAVIRIFQGHRIRAEIIRHTGDPLVLYGARVMSCTGSGEDYGHPANPLIQVLLSAQLPGRWNSIALENPSQLNAVNSARQSPGNPHRDRNGDCNKQ